MWVGVCMCVWWNIRRREDETEEKDEKEEKEISKSSRRR